MYTFVWYRSTRDLSKLYTRNEMFSPCPAAEGKWDVSPQTEPAPRSRTLQNWIQALRFCSVICRSPSLSHNLKITHSYSEHYPVLEWVKKCFRSVPTWAEETVEVSYDGSERRSDRWLVIHAAVDQVSQLCPLGSRKLVTIFIEQMFLIGQIQNCNK